MNRLAKLNILAASAFALSASLALPASAFAQETTPPSDAYTADPQVETDTMVDETTDLPEGALITTEPAEDVAGEFETYGEDAEADADADAETESEDDADEDVEGEAESDFWGDGASDETDEDPTEG